MLGAGPLDFKPAAAGRLRDGDDGVDTAEFDVDAAACRVLSGPVRRALDHMFDNFADRVSLADLSTLTQRTPFQIIRAFRRELGVTPHAMLIRIRIERATAMLARGEPIAAIAADVGFVDQTHFSRHFKRIHRQTPGRFRSAFCIPPDGVGDRSHRRRTGRKPLRGEDASPRPAGRPTDPLLAEAA